jgi:hypothetical protein
MYFQDGIEYSYNLSFTLNNVICIGWLSKDYSFNRGEVSTNVKDKLLKTIQLKSCNKMRGVHKCEFCNSEIQIALNEKRQILGHAEIWIPSGHKNIIYASPTLIYHYIDKYNYLPPNDFIESLMEFDINSDWNGDDIILDLVKSVQSVSPAR